MVPKPGYRADIDGLRAVAVLGVLFFHADLSFAGGFVGVDVFFVISGYLITRSIVSELERGSFTYSGFWTRRLRRIWPAAAVMTLVTLAVGALLLDPVRYHQLATDSIAQVFMAANFQFMRGADYFAVSSDLRALLHTWSLAVEEQFYLVYPFMLVWLWRRMRRAIVPAILLIAFASFLLSVLTLDRFPMATFYMLPTRAWELLIGAALGVGPVTLSEKSRWRGPMASLGIALIVVPMFVYDRATVFPGLAALPPCVGTALLIWAGTGGWSPVSRVLACGPLRMVGLMSYSLYLVHWPVLAMMRSVAWPVEPPLGWRVAALVVSFGLAYVSWRLVEERFRRPRTASGLGPVAIRSAAVASMILMLGVAVRVSDGWRARFPEQLLRHMEVEQVATEWETPDTAGNGIESLLTPMGCVQAEKPAFLLWGDSHAMAISELIDAKARDAGVSGMARVRRETLPVPGVRTRGPSWTPEVDVANQRVLDWVLEERIGHVILCARWTIYTDGATHGPRVTRPRTMAAPVDGPAPDESGAIAEVLADGIRELAETLEENGVTVWILLEVPYQPETPYGRAYSSFVRRLPLSTEGVSERSHGVHTINARSAIEVALTDGTRLIDLADPFFENGVSVIADERGISFYADNDHVNPTGARAVLKDALRPVMLEIAGEGASGGGN